MLHASFSLTDIEVKANENIYSILVNLITRIQLVQNNNFEMQPKLNFP